VYAVHDQPQSIEYTSQFFVHAKNKRSDDHEASDKYHIVVNAMYAVAFFPLTLLLMFIALNHYVIYPKLLTFLEQTGDATNSTITTHTVANNNSITEQPRTAANIDSRQDRSVPPQTATAQQKSHLHHMSSSNHNVTELTPIAIAKTCYGTNNPCTDEISLNSDINSEYHTTENSEHTTDNEVNTIVNDGDIIEHNNGDCDILLELLYNKDRKKAHTRALLCFSIALNLIFSIIYGLSIREFIEYYEELFCHDYDYDDDDDDDCVTGDHHIPHFQVIISVIIILFIDSLLLYKAIALCWKTEKDYFLRFTLSSLCTSITIAGVYFAPYILLALITAPLQTMFFYSIVTVLLVVCYFFFLATIPLCCLVCSCFQPIYSRILKCCSLFQFFCYFICCTQCESQFCFCKSFFSHFIKPCQSICFHKFCKLLCLSGATISIAYFFIIFYIVLTLGSINNFQDAQTVLFGVLALLLSIFVLKPLYKYLTEKKKEGNSSKPV